MFPALTISLALTQVLLVEYTRYGLNDILVAPTSAESILAYFQHRHEERLIEIEIFSLVSKKIVGGK